ncbi:MAG: oligosaccharide flippase family protein, partial [Malacoplasma sp.]
MKNKLVAILSKLKSTGFFYIFSSQILVKIVSFCGAMLIVRILSKDDYGLYSYTTNILSIFLLLDGLGTASAALQFSSEYFMDHEKKYAYMKYAFLTGFLFNIIVCCFIAISSQIISFKILGARQVLLLMSLQPLVSYFLATIQTFLRTEIKNKEYSIFNTIQSVLTIIATIGGAYWKGVNGVIICNYVAFLIIAAYGLYVSRDYLQIYKNKTHLKNLEKKDLMKYAVVSSFNNAISSLLYTIDIFVIGIFFPDTAIIASYKTATLIPFALNFIPSAIVVYIYPYFARNNQNHHWIKVKYLKLIKYFGIFN